MSDAEMKTYPELPKYYVNGRLFGLDDKDLVIICTVLICFMSLFARESSLGFMDKALSGLFGMAIGRMSK